MKAWRTPKPVRICLRRNVCVSPSCERCSGLRVNSTLSRATLHPQIHGNVSDMCGIIYVFVSFSDGIGNLWTGIASRFSTSGRGGAPFTRRSSPSLSCHGIVIDESPRLRERRPSKDERIRRLPRSSPARAQVYHLPRWQPRSSHLSCCLRLLQL